MGKNKSLSIVLQICEKYKDNRKKQIRELKKCVRSGRRSGDIFMVGAAYYHLAEICNATDDRHGVLVNALKAVTILKDTDAYELTVWAYFFLGQAYINQGNYQMSLACDELAYGIVKRHRIKGETKISALNNLSVSYHAMEEPKKGIAYLTQCIDLLKKHDGKAYTDIVMYSINLAGCYKDIGELERAENILASIFDLLEKVDFKPLVCDYYIRRAIVAYLRKDDGTGKKYMDNALAIFPQKLYLLPLYDDLCEVSRLIIKTKDRDRSKKVFDIMDDYAENNAGTVEQLFATSVMANYYKEFGDYRLASEYFAKYQELNERQMRELKEMQMQIYDTSRSAETEIRKLKRKMRENEELVSREPLTKLLNRSALLRVSSDFIETAAKKRQKVGAIFIDIDCFKECNDTYGHAKGDEIIKEVACACRKQETKNVRFARYGGDEFFGITIGLNDDEVCDVARRICRAVKSAEIPNEKNPNGGILTLSVGVVNVPITDKTDTILEIANYADKAVYYAKNAGRNAIYELFHGDGKAKDAVATYIRIDF